MDRVQICLPTEEPAGELDNFSPFIRGFFRLLSAISSPEFITLYDHVSRKKFPVSQSFKFELRCTSHFQFPVSLSLGSQQRQTTSHFLSEY